MQSVVCLCPAYCFKMKGIQRFLVFIGIILFALVQLQGQDTLSVYFEINSSKLHEQVKMHVANYIDTMNTDIIDSIYFIGVSDTVGNSKANKILSEKRAKNTSKFICKLLPDSVPIKCFAQGEESNENLDESRRVEIIFFSTPIVFKPILNCYEIDYNLLHRINVSYPKGAWKRPGNKKKRGKVTIRVNKEDIDTSRRYSYAKYNNQGEYELVNMKWRKRGLGFKSFPKSGFVSKMPYFSYDKNKFFVVSPLPCEDCQDTISTKINPIDEVSCLQTDRFLIKNMQFKRAFFNPNIVKARVLKKYINLDDSYYYGCYKNKIKWKARGGKFSKAKLPIDGIYVWNITRVMNCCASFEEPSECEKPVLQLPRIKYPNGNAFLLFHLDQEFNGEFVTNVGLSVFHDTFKWHKLLFMGMNSNLQFNTVLRFQYGFFSFPMGYFMESISWGNLSLPKATDYFSKFYVGCDLNGYIGNKDSNFSQNINLGYALVNYRNEGLIDRFFIQYEFWTLNNRSFGQQGIRIGILTRLYNLKPRNIRSAIDNKN